MLQKFSAKFILPIYLLKFSTYVTGSGKTGLIVTITDIHFLPVRESCTHALPRNTKYLIIVGQVCFYRRLFTDAVKPPGCISLPWRALIGLQTEGTPLLFESEWLLTQRAVDCISLCHKLKAHHCHKLKAHHCSLGLSGCCNPPSASHPPPPPPSRPPTPYRIDP